MARVQTGLIARRDADGNFLQAEPIYEDLPVEKNGLTAAENQAYKRFAKDMAKKFAEYVQHAKIEGYF